MRATTVNPTITPWPIRAMNPRSPEIAGRVCLVTVDAPGPARPRGEETPRSAAYLPPTGGGAWTPKGTVQPAHRMLLDYPSLSYVWPSLTEALYGRRSDISRSIK